MDGAVNYGRIALLPKGEYSESEQYDQGDVVSYNGNSYICKAKAPIGTLPTNQEYFQIGSLKGDKGVKGDKGDKGDDGSTPHIGDNGNWWIGTTDTGVPASGNFIAGDNIQITQDEGEKRISAKDVCSVFFAYEGNSYKIPELGATNATTLKELCESMINYKMPKRVGLEVVYWINSNSAIGRGMADLTGYSVGNGDMFLVRGDYTVYITYRLWTDATAAIPPMIISTYSKVNGKNSFSSWKKIDQVTVDSALSESSENPVQNKAVSEAIAGLNTAAKEYKFFYGSDGASIPELGVTKNTTLLDLCKSIIQWKRNGKSRSIEVCFWVNRNTQIGKDVQAGLGTTNTFGLLRCYCADSVVYITYRTYTGGTPAPMALNTYNTVSGASSLTGWRKISPVTVDSALSASSTNPVQNKAVKAAIDALGAPVIISATAPSNTNALWVKPGGS